MDVCCLRHHSLIEIPLEDIGMLIVLMYYFHIDVFFFFIVLQWTLLGFFILNIIEVMKLGSYN